MPAIFYALRVLHCKDASVAIAEAASEIAQGATNYVGAALVVVALLLVAGHALKLI